MTASSKDLDGATGLMELFRGGKISAEVASPFPTTPSTPTTTTPSPLPPKKRRLESAPENISAIANAQPKARPSSSHNGPVVKPLSLANIRSNMANTLAVDLIQAFGGWPFAPWPLQNKYVSPMLFMAAATQACTPNKRKKLYDTNMPQESKTPAPAAARPVAAANPMAQHKYQQHLLAQSSMAHGTIFSPQCKTPSQAWQPQAQPQDQPVPRAPAFQQRTYPAAGQNYLMAARWQASLHALLSRGDLAENNHRLLDPIATCDASEVAFKVRRLPSRQVDVLHPEVRSLIAQFQQDLSPPPSRPPSTRHMYCTMHAPEVVLNAVQVQAWQQGRAY